MSIPATQTVWNGLLALELELGANSMIEKRLENDSSGKILYVGLSNIPNASTSELVWFICKCSYDTNGFLSRYQLPDDGVGLRYSWDDRATYFS